MVPTTKCMDILMDLFDKNKKEDNSAVLSHMIENAKKNDFPALAKGRQYGKMKATSSGR